MHRYEHRVFKWLWGLTGSFAVMSVFILLLIIALFCSFYFIILGIGTTPDSTRAAFLLPWGVLAAFVYGIHKFKRYRSDIRDTEYRQQVLTEAGRPLDSIVSRPYAIIKEVGPISLLDLEARAGMSHEQLIDDIRSLMQSRLISQSIVNGRAVYAVIS